MENRFTRIKRAFVILLCFGGEFLFAQPTGPDSIGWERCNSVLESSYFTHLGKNGFTDSANGRYVYYHYSTKHDSLRILERIYTVWDTDKTTELFATYHKETYYLYHGKILNASIEEDLIFKSTEPGRTFDTMPWTGEFWFWNGTVVWYFTNGHGYGEMDDFVPENFVAGRLEETKTPVLEKIPVLK